METSSRVICTQSLKETAISTGTWIFCDWFYRRKTAATCLYCFKQCNYYAEYAQSVVIHVFQHSLQSHTSNEKISPSFKIHMKKCSRHAMRKVVQKCTKMNASSRKINIVFHALNWKSGTRVVYNMTKIWELQTDTSQDRIRIIFIYHSSYEPLHWCDEPRLPYRLL